MAEAAEVAGGGGGGGGGGGVQRVSAEEAADALVMKASEGVGGVRGRSQRRRSQRERCPVRGG